MSEESQVVAEVTPASGQVATAAPVAEDGAPEVVPAAEPKTFTQEELDAAIGKRLAREQRKWERQQSVRVEKPAAPVEVKSEQFESTEAYAEALALQKAEQLLAQRDAERQQTEVEEAFHERVEAAMEKYDDFKQVVENPTLKITKVMAETIKHSEIGPEVAYHLGTNPKEAERISKLVPFLQAKEIGRIEAKLADAPPTRKTSTAPAPITPVTGNRNTAAKVHDTTDPRAAESMSTSEWIAADRARQMKKLGQTR